MVIGFIFCWNMHQENGMTMVRDMSIFLKLLLCRLPMNLVEAMFLEI